MHDTGESDPRRVAGADEDIDDVPTVLTSPADIASAGRSCMAILVLVAVIVLILLVWIVYRSTSAGQ